MDFIAYEPRAAGTTAPWVRTTLNIGVILSAEEGCAAYVLDGVRHTAPLPALVFARPGWHCGADNVGRCEKVYFTYPARAVAAFPGFKNDPRHLLMPLARASAALFSLGELMDHAARPLALGGADRLDLLALRFLTECLIHHRAASHEMPDEAQRLDAAAADLDRRYASPVDLDALARRAGFSPRTFHRRWRARYGDSPHGTLLRRRIDAACRLLSGSEAPIGRIAEAVGFDDPYYFSRLFKKYTGHSPKGYRRLQARGG